MQGNKFYDLGVNKSEICGGSSNLMKCTMWWNSNWEVHSYNEISSTNSNQNGTGMEVTTEMSSILEIPPEIKFVWLKFVKVTTEMTSALQIEIEDEICDV